MEWYWILLIVLTSVVFWLSLSVFFYKCFFKRFYDFLISGIGLIVLSPLFLLLTICGLIAMKGNPFFLQTRPGKKEKLFSLIKFRTMSFAKDRNGRLLSNEKRLNRYGRFLRSTSLDELPELLNIFIGNMSFVGPRPLLPEYLPYYKENERIRHSVRPGLTGFAQINGRNNIKSWEERFSYDIDYVNNFSFFMDVNILFKTFLKVFQRQGVLSGDNVVVGRLDEERKSND